MEAKSAAGPAMGEELKITRPAGVETTYDDAIVKLFLIATVLWGVVGMLVGVTIALQLAWWPANLGLPWTTFGRLRPLHTNAVIFAFGGNICFTGIYYSMQRLLKTRMWSDWLSRFHFWGYQAIIVAAADAPRLAVMPICSRPTKLIAIENIVTVSASDTNM